MPGFGNNFPTGGGGGGNATKIQGLPVSAPTVPGTVLEYTALGLEWVAGPDPGPHAPTHGVGGTDPVSLDMSQVPTGQLPAARVGGGTVSDTEYGYLDGVTSAIQTQLNGKLATNGNASSLTSIPAGQLTGSVADARLSANVDLLNAAQTFTARKTFPSAGANAAQIPAILGGASNTSGHVVPNVADDTFALLAAAQTLTNKTISGSSNTLTNIPAANLTGSVADARLSANVDLLNTAQTFTARKTFPAAGANAAQIPAILGGASNTNGHTVPNAVDDTFALLAATQTLSNKTLSSPTLSGTASGTYTLGGTPTLGASLSVADNSFGIGDTTHRLTQLGALSVVSGATSLALTSNVADGASAVGLAVNNSTTLANAASRIASFRNNATEKAAVLFDGTLVAPKVGPASGQFHTLPAVTSDTVALLAATQTLTNKTLTNGTVSGGTISGSSISGSSLSGTYSLGGTPSLGAALNANGFKVTNLGAPASSTDAARMDYVVSTVCMATSTNPSGTGFWFYGVTGPMTQDPTIVVPFIIPYNGTIDAVYWQANAAAPSACFVDVRKSANTTPPYLYNLAIRLNVASGDTRGNSGVGLTVSAGDTFIIAYGDFGVQWNHGGMTVSFSLRRS